MITPLSDTIRKIQFVIFHLTVHFMVLSSVQVIGQEETGSPLEKIKEAYNRFNYTEVVSLSLKTLETAPPPSRQEQVEIYTYMAFAHVALGKRDEAIQNFESALELDPTLTLDPIYVSPKIIALFEEVKLARETEGEEQIKYPQIPTTLERDMRSGGAWRSLVLPGWGQLYKGHKRKAIAIFVVQALNVSTLVYAHFKTEKTHDEYLQARMPDDIESKYNRYNTFYKLRTYVVLSTAAVWLYSHIDAALTSPALETTNQTNERTHSLTPMISDESIKIALIIRF